jgi:hypothetical protein
MCVARAINHRAFHARPRLTVEQILAWGDAHFAAIGRWPAVAVH